MSTDALETLRELRLAGERQAERALADAAAALRVATDEQARLDERVVAAASARRVARTTAGLPETARDAQTTRAFWARRDAEAHDADAASQRHRAEALAAAIRAEADARAAHLRARQRREVVEKAIARRQEVRRRERDRRAEAAADDLGPRRKG